MQLANCYVHLGGDRNHVVFKQRVTVAEIEILRALHGEDAIVDIQPVGNQSRNHNEEMDRLRRIYRRKLPGPDSKGSKNIVDLVYPGPRPQLPTTLADIGVNYPSQAAAKKKAAAKKNSKPNDPSAQETAQTGGEGDEGNEGTEAGDSSETKE